MCPRVGSRASERGAILVHVAIGLVALLAFSALAIDYGILWVSRGQAQNAADAGALAGAVALSYDDYTDRTATGPAVTSAVAVAARNFVWGEAPSVTSADVTFPTCPASAGGGPDCVRVDVFRNTGRGNPLPTLFAQLVGHWQPGGLHELLQLRALGKVQAIRNYHSGLRSLANDFSDSGGEFRRRAGDNAQRNEIQRGTGALCTRPEHGM